MIRAALSILVVAILTAMNCAAPEPPAGLCPAPFASRGGHIGQGWVHCEEPR